MLNKNSVLLGFMLGMLLPVIAWLIFYVMQPTWVLLNKPAIPYLIAIGINLFIIKICYKKDADDTGKGVMMATFLTMVLLIVFKIRLT